MTAPQFTPLSQLRLAPHATRIIGLTGGIASGKSTVSRVWRQLGAVVIDADQVARDVVAIGSEGLSAVLAHFGSDLRLPSGGLDRRALGAIVFADPAQLQQLEFLLHPWIRGQIAANIATARAEDATAVVIDAALLIEMGLHHQCDLVVVVYCGVQRQIARLMRRDGFDEAAARRRIAAQSDDATRLAAADLTIDNHGSLQELETQAETLWLGQLVAEGNDGEGETED